MGRKIGLLSISAGTGSGLLRLPLQFQLKGLLGGVAANVLRPRLDLLFAAGLMVPDVLLAHFLVIVAEILHLSGSSNPVPLLGLKLPFCEGLIIPARLRLQSLCAFVQPLEFGGLLLPAFLRQRLHPAAYAVMAGLNAVGYAVALLLNRP